MLAKLAHYRKAITAEASILLSWYLVAYVPDGVVTRLEWSVLVVGVAAGLGVGAIPNVLTAAQVQEHVASHPEDAPTVVTTVPAPSMDDNTALPTVPPPGEAPQAGHDGAL